MERITNDLSAIVFGEAYELPVPQIEIAVDAAVLERYSGPL